MGNDDFEGHRKICQNIPEKNTPLSRLISRRLDISFGNKLISVSGGSSSGVVTSDSSPVGQPSTLVSNLTENRVTLPNQKGDPLFWG